MDAFLTSLVVLFVAELGDKTQLLALAFAARQSLPRVLSGVTLANVATQGLSVLAGGLLGVLVRGPALSLVAALLFFGFAAWTLLERDDEDSFDAAEPADRGRAPTVVAGIATAVFLAEVGDKSMLATMTLATRQSLIGTWLGASLGMTLAGLVAMLAGRGLAARLPERPLRIAAAVLFAGFGVVLLLDALR